MDMFSNVAESFSNNLKETQGQVTVSSLQKNNSVLAES